MTPELERARRLRDEAQIDVIWFSDISRQILRERGASINWEMWHRLKRECYRTSALVTKMQNDMPRLGDD